MSPKKMNRPLVKYFEAPDFKRLEEMVNKDINSNGLSIRDIQYRHNMFEDTMRRVVHNCSTMIIYDPPQIQD